MKAILMILLVLCSVSIINGQYVERTLCSSKCLCLLNEGLVACHASDNIQAVPTNIDKSMTRLIIQNGVFYRPTLHSFNFTNLEQITFLKIVYYNLEYIAPKTFSNLSKLLYLDLSHNRLFQITPNALYKLQLKELHLMVNRELRILKDSFNEMTSTTINLRSCNLTRLDYESFRFTQVKYLYLYNNHIENVDIRFSNLFNEHSLLDLSDNPLNCNCSLTWLIKYLKLTQNSDLNSNKNKNNQLNIRCNKPSNLKNRDLLTITHSDLKCLPLKITEIFLNLYKDSLELSCIAKIGSNPLNKINMKWLGLNSANKNSINEFTVEENTTFDSQNNMIGINTMRMRYDYMNKDFVKLMCMANSSSTHFEKLELDLRNFQSFINWNKTIDTFDTNENFRYRNFNFLFDKHFSLLELLSTIFGTFIVTFFGMMLVLKCMRVHMKLLKYNDSPNYNLNNLSFDHSSHNFGVYPQNQTPNPISVLPNAVSSHSNCSEAAIKPIIFNSYDYSSTYSLPHEYLYSSFPFLSNFPRKEVLFPNSQSLLFQKVE